MVLALLLYFGFAAVLGMFLQGEQVKIGSLSVLIPSVWVVLILLLML